MVKGIFLFLIIIDRTTYLATGLFVYNTDKFSSTIFEHDCVHFEIQNDELLYTVETFAMSQTIRYCLRPSSTVENYLPVIETHKLSRSYDTFTFEQLYYTYNTTTAEILSNTQYTSVDDIERYTIYSATLNKSISQEKMHKCRNSWFGSVCQYIFNFHSPIQLTLHSSRTAYSFERHLKRSSNISILSMTCYTHLICNRGLPPACLDWREICDGKIDCANDNRIDELFCEHLEIIECAKNEYRCSNGRQCIPEEFYRDDPLNPDCQDGSDEILSNSIESLTYPHECDRDPAFRCEERTCPPNTLSCGDGQCVTFYHQCNNHRGQLLIMEYQIYKGDRNLSSCLSLPYSCGTHIDRISDCKSSCWGQNIVLCKAGLNQLCASTIFKQSPYYFRPNHDMYIFYNDNPIPSRRSWIIAPHDDCYNDTHCYNTDIYLDNPFLFWCQRNRAKMHLSYVGSYSRSDFTATIQRLTKRCYNYSGIYHLYNDSSPRNHHQSQMRMITVSKTSRNGFQTNNWIDDLEFLKLCNGIQHFNSKITDSGNQTYETECEYWPCNNIYTRCNGYINCPDGIDELNCTLIRCMDDEVLCVSLYSRKLECLPQNKVQNFKIDCIGGTDERIDCKLSPFPISQDFACSLNGKCINKTKVCNDITDCPRGEDELICDSFLLNIVQAILNCGYSAEFIYAHSSDITCSSLYFPKITFLSSMDLVAYPLIKSIENGIFMLRTKNKPMLKNDVVPKKVVSIPPENADHYCHRGLDVYMAIPSNKSFYERKCFCPPSYYGNRCQYQSDRVSLTLRMQFSVNHRNAFILSITLIDKNYHINSFYIHKHQPFKDCDTKFNHYLLYSTPEKDKENNYSIHIDIFKEEDLSYYASWYLPVHHSFLPVSRIAALLKTPHERILSKRKSHCNVQCQHGQCIKYSNMEKYFCQCQSGWYGLSCEIKQHCDCSFNSLCMGSVHGRSICICPPDKFGPRCLFNSSCQTQVCQNGGTCVPDIDDKYGHRKQSSQCVCTNEFEGGHCQYRKSMVSIRFVEVQIYSFMIIHILSDFTLESHAQITTFQKLSLKSSTADIFISSDINVNLIFVQFDRKYYLVVVRDSTTSLSTISTVVSVKQQCQHVSNLFNSIMNKLTRLKQYPRLCREQKDLICFHDEKLMCLCTTNRFSNCFKFHFKKDPTCQNVNPCEKEGRCLQDRPNCPSIVECICSECYYGTRCQFSTVGLGVSLDAMLGYEILPMKSFSQQSKTVKVSTIITTCIFIFGLISNTMSILTFRHNQSHEIGCKKYLLTLSITSLLTIIMFTLKFSFFLFVQMSIITDANFLYVNCLLMEVLTKICLSATNWLSACIAIERTVSVIQQMKFNRKKSKQMATKVVFALIFCVVLTHLSDPIHRVLINDEDEQRKWCVVRYPSSMERFNSINLFLHFVVPFIVNGISAMIIIIMKARIRFSVKKQKSYSLYLLEEVHLLGHLLISPCILVLLSVPRLILAFLPGCMKTTEDLWIYLAGYFVSFVPALLTFPIFVLPSGLYRKEFKNRLESLIKAISRLYRHK